MRNFKYWCVFGVLAVVQGLWANGGVLDGLGTDASPFLIADTADLRVVGTGSYATDAHYRLVRTLDYSGKMLPLIAEGNKFMGTFHGGGHLIRRGTFSSFDRDIDGRYVRGWGLFSWLGSSAVVDSLGLDGIGCDGSCRYYQGGAALALESDGTVTECFTAGTLPASSYVAALVKVNRGLVQNSYSTVSTSASDQMGLVFENDGKIVHSYYAGNGNNSNVNGNGLVGNPDSSSGTVEDSYWNKEIFTGHFSFYNALIDTIDMDDYNSGTGGYWYVYTDPSGTTVGNSYTSADGIKDYEVSQYSTEERNYGAAILSYTLGTEASSSYLAIGTSIGSGFYPASCSDGFSYRYKGAPHRFRAQMSIVTDGDYHGKTRSEAADDWTTVVVAPTDLLQTNGSVPYDGALVSAFEWSINGAPQSGNLWIDDFQCLGGNMAKSPAKTANIYKATALTTVQMQVQSNYQNWDFVNKWEFLSGSFYPTLRGINSPPVAVADRLATLDTADLSALLTNDYDPEGSGILVARLSGGLLLNNGRDSLIAGYRVGELLAVADTLWGDSSTVTVPYVANNPFYSYTIGSYVDLLKIGKDWRYPLFATYKLTSDIDASSSRNGKPFRPIPGYLSGTFDGQGHAIQNLYIVNDSASCVGFFRRVNSGAVQNLFLANVDVWTMGEFESTGALVGCAEGGIIDSVVISGHVQGYNYVGGLVGSGGYGLQVRNSYSLAKVEGHEVVGGLMGRLNSYNLYSSYAAGPVVATGAANGLGNGYGSHSYNYWNPTLAGISASESGTPLDLTQMRAEASFTDWDFAGTWKIIEGVTFPGLRGMDNPAVALPDNLDLFDPENLAPLLANDFDIDNSGVLVARLTGGSTMNASKDSLKIEYQVGTLSGSDTVWGGYAWAAIAQAAAIEIATFQQLQAIGNDWRYPLNGNYIQTSDINAVSSPMAPIGNWSHPFQGSFNGNGHLILNVTMLDSSYSNKGLFGVVGKDGHVYNLGVVNAHIANGYGHAGIVAGMNYGTIHHVYSTGSVVNHQPNYQYSYLGGLVGQNEGSLTHSYSLATLPFASEYDARYDRVGQIAGANLNAAVIHQCYGAVKGLYARTALQLPAVGRNNATLDSTYWLDLDGVSDSTTAARGLAALVISVTYTGWDFSAAGDWEIKEGKTYPGLRVLNDPPMAQTVAVKANGADFSASLLNGVSGGIDVEGATVLAKPAGRAYYWSVSGDSLHAYILAGESLGGGDTLWGGEAVAHIVNTVVPLYQYEDLALLWAKDSSGANYAQGRFRLMNDIDASASASDETGLFPVDEFHGTLYGDGHAISHLQVKSTGNCSWNYFSEPDYDGCDGGFIGYVAGTAVIQDLGLVEFVDTLYNISSNYERRQMVGALAGRNYGRIVRSYASGKVASDRFAGGLTGINYGTIEQSYSSVDVFSKNYVAGGLAGYNEGSILDAYASGRIQAGSYAGGLVGYQGSGGSVTRGFATSRLNALTVGGIVGYSANASILSCSWDSTLSGSVNTRLGTPWGRSQFAESNNFVAWNFTDIWGLSANGYPYLRNVNNPPSSVPDAQATYPATDAQLMALVANDSDPENASSMQAVMLEDVTLNEAMDSTYFFYRPGETLADGSVLWGHIGYVAVPAQEIEIASYEDLLKIGKDWQHPQNGRYRLVADLDAQASWSASWIPIGTSIKPFNGIFHGNNHIIRNLKSYAGSSELLYSGLFGVIGAKGVVDSLGLAGANIHGDYSQAGILAGLNKGTIDRVFVTGKVYGKNTAGALVAENQGAISNCYTAAILGSNNPNSHIEGALAAMNSGSISNCYSASTYWWSYTGTYEIPLIGSDDGNAISTYSLFKRNPATLKASEFTDWNFSSIWQLDNGQYPVLRGFGKIPMGIPDPGAASVVLEDVASLTGNDIKANAELGLIAQRLDASYMNKARGDSLYAFYRVGQVLAKGDTLWGGPTWFSVYYPQVAIASYAELKKIGRDWRYPLSANYQQTADIDAAASKTETSLLGTGFLPIGAWSTSYAPAYFSGSYHGGGYAIRNLRIKSDYNGQSIGLFASVGPDAWVDSVNLRNGELAGWSQVGGIAGANYGEIAHCANSGQVSGYESVGGIVGDNQGLVRQSFFSGLLSGRMEIGPSHNMGGIAGSNTGSIANSYATGRLENGGSVVGGLVGAHAGVIRNSYASAWVSANNWGGLVGFLDDSSQVENSYYDSSSYHGYSVSGGTGLARDSLQVASHFENWDFSSVWEIRAGSMPGLRGINDAPFAHMDTAASIDLTETMLVNDIDVESASLVLKITSYTEVKDSVVYCGYRIGEVIADNDTLWGGATWAIDTSAGYILVQDGYRHKGTVSVDYKLPYYGDSTTTMFYLSTDKENLDDAFHVLSGPGERTGSFPFSLSGYKNGSLLWVIAETKTPHRTRYSYSPYPIRIDSTAPDMVSDLRVYAVSADAIQLRWTAPFDNNNADVVGYRLYWQNQCGLQDGNVNLVAHGRGSTEEYILSGLASSSFCGENGYFRVYLTSTDSVGNVSDVSNFAIVELNETDGDATPPTFAALSPRTVNAGQTFNITATITDASGIYVSGGEPTDQSARIEYSSDEKMLTIVSEYLTRIDTGAQYRSPQLSGLSVGATLYYRLYACDDDSDNGSADRSCGYSEIHQVTATETSGDDDSQGPVFADMIQGKIFDNTSISLKATITDLSDVFDDATGSSGQGVYAEYRWDNSGSWTELQMERIGSTEEFSGVKTLAVGGAQLNWRVSAYDNDADNGDVADRAKSTSSEAILVVIDDDQKMPSFANFTPQTIEASTVLAITAELTDASGVYDIAGSKVYSPRLEYGQDAALSSFSTASMQRTGTSAVFASTSLLGLSEGAILYYRIYACDNDLDFGEDRTCGYSEIHQLAVTASTSIDDDVQGPVIVGISQGLVLDNVPLRLAAAITDLSGVYDDETGSAGQGVYAEYRWDNSGAWVEAQMERAGTSDSFRTVAAIAVLGSQLSWKVTAFDNDNDNSEASDRSKSVSQVGVMVVNDDDGTGPTFASFSPLNVPAGNPVYVTVAITDASDVYDDGTGSAGQGVYLEYRTTVAGTVQEIQMEKTDGNLFRTLEKLPALSSGQTYYYRVRAYDNDNDRGVPDRSGTYSDWHSIDEKAIENDSDLVAPEFASLTAGTVNDAGAISLYATITDESGVYDDSTGAGGQGVYARYSWNNGAWRTITFSLVSGSRFESDSALTIPTAGSVLAYQIYAFDNDQDAGELDRTQGVSSMAMVFVTDDDTLAPIIVPDVASSVLKKQTVLINAQVQDPSGVAEKSVQVRYGLDESTMDTVAMVLNSQGVWTAKILPNEKWSQFQIQILACDSDKDGGRTEDRSCGASQTVSVRIDKLLVNGVVTTLAGKSLPGVQVQYALPSGKSVAAVTDAEGTYSLYLAEMPPYYVSYSLAGYLAGSDSLPAVPDNALRKALPRIANFDQDSADLVDSKDLVLLAKQWKTVRNESGWKPLYDIGPATGYVSELRVDPDDVVDYEDLLVFARVWKAGLSASLEKVGALSENPVECPGALSPINGLTQHVRLVAFRWTNIDGEAKIDWKLPSGFLLLDNEASVENGERVQWAVYMGKEDYPIVDASWLSVASANSHSAALVWSMLVYDGDNQLIQAKSGYSLIAPQLDMASSGAFRVDRTVFESQLTLRVDVSSVWDRKFQVMDVQGQLLETVLLRANETHVIWDASKYVAGVYWIREGRIGPSARVVKLP